MNDAKHSALMQALEALKMVDEAGAYYDRRSLRATIAAIRAAEAALAEPVGEPVAWMVTMRHWRRNQDGSVHYEIKTANEFNAVPFDLEFKAPEDHYDVEIPLCALPAPVAPLNLSDPAVQKRLAAQWGYVLATAPVAQPLTDDRSMIALREWAVGRWRDEVEIRPLINKTRRPLDDTWRQVMRYAGLDPDAAVGPAHDELVQRINGIKGADPAPVAPRAACDGGQCGAGGYCDACPKRAPAPVAPTDEQIDALWREACSAQGHTTAALVRKFARAVLALRDGGAA